MCVLSSAYLKSARHSFAKSRHVFQRVVVFARRRLKGGFEQDHCLGERLHDWNITILII